MHDNHSNMMDVEKKLVLKKLLPKAVLKAMTPEAQEAVPIDDRTDDLVRIDRFPFRMGRECRFAIERGKIQINERRRGSDCRPNNDLYIVDSGERLNISRTHLAIVKSGDQYVALDRGSACGSIVNDTPIGGHDCEGQCGLNDGDIITLGVKGSPYQYQFILLDFENFS